MTVFLPTGVGSTLPSPCIRPTSVLNPVVAACLVYRLDCDYTQVGTTFLPANILAFCLWSKLIPKAR